MGGILPIAAITAETLELAKAAIRNPESLVRNGPGLMKSGINIAEGLVGINLEAPSKKLFPVYSPLRNRTPRIKAAVGASAVQWKEIAAINSANLWAGVAENTRNSFNTTLTNSRTASFITLGHDDYVGFEALAQSKNFEDVRATSALNLLYSLMISEEKMILGGNAVAIAKPASVTVVASDTGGALAVGTYNVRVSALTLMGYDQGATGHGSTDAAGETDARNNTAAGVIGAVTTGSLAVTWPAVKGAVAYNVFVTAAGGAVGTATYKVTVTVNAFLVTTLAVSASTNVGNTSDQTAQSTQFEGIIAQIEKNASSALFVDQANASLTSDSAGGIVEFDAMLKSMWDLYRLGPTAIFVNSTEASNITKKIGGSSSLSYRIYLQDGQKNVTGGIYVGAYLNKFASSFAEGFPNEVPIKIHPNLPQGTILFYVEQLPYPNNQVPNVWEIETLMEYTQYEWALSTRKYEFGIYAMEVLKGYFNVAQGAIVGVKAT